MTRLTRLFLLSAAIGLLFAGSNVSASIINGSFESGMSGWTTVGPNSAVPNGTINGYNATSGSEYAFINTGVGAQSVLVQDFVLQSLGISSNYVSTNFPGVTEGSLLFQTFTLDAGCNELVFDWNFLTNEGGNNDFAFAHLFDSSFAPVSTASLNTSSSLSAGSPDYLLDTGWQNVSFSGLTGGNTYTLVFGVFDDRDFITDTALLVDNVHCVPEPSAGALLSLVGLTALRLRRRTAN